MLVELGEAERVTWCERLRSAGRVKADHVTWCERLRSAGRIRGG